MIKSYHGIYCYAKKIFRHENVTFSIVIVVKDLNGENGGQMSRKAAEFEHGGARENAGRKAQFNRTDKRFVFLSLK